MSNPLEPLANLGRRLRDDVEPHGLRQVGFAALPELDDNGPDRIRGVYVVGPAPDPDAATIAGILAATADAEPPDQDT